MQCSQTTKRQKSGFLSMVDAGLCRFGFWLLGTYLPDATVAYDGPPDAAERGAVFVLAGKTAAGNVFGGQHELDTDQTADKVVNLSSSTSGELITGGKGNSLVNASIFNALSHASNSIILVDLS